MQKHANPRQTEPNPQTKPKTQNKKQTEKPRPNPKNFPQPILIDPQPIKQKHLKLNTAITLKSQGKKGARKIV